MICPVHLKLHFNHLFTPKNKTKEKPTINGLSYHTNKSKNENNSFS